MGLASLEVYCNHISVQPINLSASTNYLSVSEPSRDHHARIACTPIEPRLAIGRWYASTYSPFSPFFLLTTKELLLLGREGTYDATSLVLAPLIRAQGCIYLFMCVFFILGFVIFVHL